MAFSLLNSTGSPRLASAAERAFSPSYFSSLGLSSNPNRIPSPDSHSIRSAAHQLRRYSGVRQRQILKLLHQRAPAFHAQVEKCLGTNRPLKDRSFSGTPSHFSSLFSDGDKKSGPYDNSPIGIQRLPHKSAKGPVSIAVVSDVHHSPYSEKETENLARRVREINPDMLLVAGDVANGLDYFRPALEILSGRWKTLVLPGNHDVWNTWLDKSSRPAQGPGSRKLWEDVLPRLTAEAGAIWLEGRTVIVPEIGLGIAGTIGWYDYSGEEIKRPIDQIVAEKFKYTGDAGRVDWDWNDAQFASSRKEGLYNSLQALSENSDVRQIFVATHMPPFLQLRSDVTLEGNNRGYYDPKSAYYFTPTLGAMIMGFPKVTHVVSGHTHFGKSVQIERPSLPPIEARVVDNYDENEVALYNFS